MWIVSELKELKELKQLSSNKLNRRINGKPSRGPVMHFFDVGYDGRTSSQQSCERMQGGTRLHHTLLRTVA